MPHTARKRGSTGYYHIVPKGESNRLLFEDDCDRLRYLDELREVIADLPVRVHAYVLMSNHNHIVAESMTGDWDPLASMMKQVDERYAIWFKRKSGRAGCIFGKSLWAEPIERDAYLLYAARYVHANPAVAGICPASTYRWSSARAYLGHDDGITCTDMVLGLLGGKEGFIAFSRKGLRQAVPFPGSKLTRHLSDEEALRVAQSVVGKDVLEDMGRATLREAGPSFKQLRACGLSLSQIARLTGFSNDRVKAYFRRCA